MQNLGRATHNHVKPIRVVLLELLPLRLRVRSVELDILVPCVQLACQFCLDALVRRDHDLGRPVELEELREDDAGGPGADDEGLHADLDVQPVQAVDGARGGLDERGLFIGDIIDLEDLASVAVGGAEGGQSAHVRYVYEIATTKMLNEGERGRKTH